MLADGCIARLDSTEQLAAPRGICELAGPTAHREGNGCAALRAGRMRAHAQLCARGIAHLTCLRRCSDARLLAQPAHPRHSMLSMGEGCADQEAAPSAHVQCVHMPRERYHALRAKAGTRAPPTELTRSRMMDPTLGDFSRRLFGHPSCGWPRWAATRQARPCRAAAGRSTMSITVRKYGRPPLRLARTNII